MPQSRKCLFPACSASHLLWLLPLGSHPASLPSWGPVLSPLWPLLSFLVVELAGKLSPCDLVFYHCVGFQGWSSTARQTEWFELCRLLVWRLEVRAPAVGQLAPLEALRGLSGSHLPSGARADLAGPWLIDVSHQVSAFLSTWHSPCVCPNFPCVRTQSHWAGDP